MFELARWFRRGLPTGAETCTITPPGLAPLRITGVASGDPFIFGQLRSGKAFEQHVLATMRALLAPASTVFDVGANIGWFSACLSQLVGPGGRVVAIEPAPQNLALLRHNLRQNKARNVQVIAAAAGASQSHIWLRLSAANAGDHRIGGAGPAPDTIKVRLMDLDSVARGRGPVLVKLDVQGAEPSVLDGARAVLAGPDVRLITEFWPHGLVDCVSSPAALIDRLTRHFQRFWALFQDQLPYEVTPETLLQMSREGLRPETHMFTDIVCLRATDHAGIAAMQAASAWYPLLRPG